MQKNFCGAFTIDQLVEDFTKCASRVIEGVKAMKLPFAVVNTDPIATGGTQWITLIKLQDESFFLFDSFGLVGFNTFIRSDDGRTLSTFVRDFNIVQQGSFEF